MDAERSQPLSAELAYFDSRKPELLQHYEGKFVVIKGDTLLGAFDTVEHAYDAGIKAYGESPFLVKQVLREDPPVQIPALFAGVLNAAP